MSGTNKGPSWHQEQSDVNGTPDLRGDASEDYTQPDLSNNPEIDESACGSPGDNKGNEKQSLLELPLDESSSGGLGVIQGTLDTNSSFDSEYEVPENQMMFPAATSNGPFPLLANYQGPQEGINILIPPDFSLMQLEELLNEMDQLQRENESLWREYEYYRQFFTSEESKEFI